MHLYTWHIYLVSFCALLVTSKESNQDEKGSEIRYNSEWQEELKSYLPSNETIDRDSQTRTLAKTTVPKNLTSVTQHLQSNIVKKSNIRKTEHIGKKKDIVFQIVRTGDNKLDGVQTLRQTIDDPGDNINSKIGRAFGERETYQSIGDGIYLMRSIPENTETNKSKMKTMTKLSDTAKSIGSIIGSLDKEDKELLDGNNLHDGNSQSLALENDMKTSSEVFPHNQFQSADESIEGVQPKELNLISDIQSNLKNEDKTADQNINAEAAAAHENSAFQLEGGQNGIVSIAKAVQDTDREFIKRNPLVIDPNSEIAEPKSTDETSKQFFKNQLVDPDDVNVPTIPMYKKDLTVLRPFEKQHKASEAYKLLASVNKADSNIQQYAKSKKTFDPDSKLDERENDIVNFAAQEDAQIMVGGSRSHKTRKHKRRKTKKRKHDELNKTNLLKVVNLNASQEKTSDDIDEAELRKILTKNNVKNAETTEGTDTGFFMADESDIANLNKNTEDFVSKTVNASLVDIIEPSLKDYVKKKDNVTSETSNDQVEEALNTLTPDQPTQLVNLSTPRNHKQLHGKKHPPKIFKHKTAHLKHHQKLDKEDMALIETLNKTSWSKNNRHHSGSVWKVNMVNKPNRIINVAGKPGVQIDLYISPNKLKKKYSKEHRTTKTNIQPNLLGSSEGSSHELADVEDVSLSEVVNNQEKQMFGDTSNDYNDVKGNSDVLQTNNHLEGNEAKQGGNDISIQDAINSEELQTAMKESDLKGLNAIKTELDIQDAKNTVDFFNQPNGAKPLAHHIESTTLDELNQQIKEAETESLDNEKGFSVEKNKNVGDPQRVKIILHIPETIGKHRGTTISKDTDDLAQETKALASSQDENTVAMMKTINRKKHEGKFDDATLEAAKKIEEFIKQEAAKETDEEAEGATIKPPETELVISKNLAADNKDEETGEQILSALLKASNSFRHHYRDNSSLVNEGISEHIKEYVNTSVPVPLSLEAKSVKELKEIGKVDSSLHTFENPHPTSTSLENFIKTTKEQTLSKVPVKVTNTVLPTSSSNHINAASLRINGGKVIGGNVRGGTIIGGVVSGGDVSGGEIRGGIINGGMFKSGLFIDGDMENGVVEGGKINGGKILGGDVKSGIIDGGIIKGGIIDGGHLVNGTVEGGVFKGGEILGGRLLAGEMDGGVLKNGTINGGILKGGVIESGSLDGGVMFSGTLRGGVIKSGVIKGGIIDKGVIVQDAEIGPGVEIHDGIVKGGKITVTSLLAPVPGAIEGMFNPPVPETIHTDENRSNIMYTLKVLPKPTESFKASVIKRNDTDVPLQIISEHPEQQDVPMIKVVADDIMDKQNDVSESSNRLTNSSSNLIESFKIMNGNEIENHLSSIASLNDSVSVKSIDKTISIDEKKISTYKQKEPAKTQAKVSAQTHPAILKSPKKAFLINTERAQKPTMGKLQSYSNQRKVPTIGGGRRMNVNQDSQKIQSLLKQLQYTEKLREEKIHQATAKMYARADRIRNEQSAVTEEQPVAHWELSKSKNNVIMGNPGPKLRISGGVRIHNGHAILDGVNGYMDAGDYQGECFSDPEACENGFTIQMTLKIYRDSVFNTSRLFLIDSGAWSKDSRGVSVYVSDGRIGGIIVTRDQTWCIHKILEPYIEKWMTMTVTWRSDKGLLLYINCDLFDQSLTHSPSECDQCTTKGGCHKTDIATRLMFGRPNKGPHFKVIHMAVGEISLFEKYSDKDEVEKMCGSKENPLSISAVASIIQQPSQSRLSDSGFFMKSAHQNANEGYAWPTPSPIHSHQVSAGSRKETVDNVGPWPTPGRLAPVVTRMQTTESPHSLVDPNTDRRSLVHELDGGYSSWMEWSPCSQSCGKGVQISVRYCTNPSPQIGGKDCYHIGSPRKFRPCRGNNCLDNGRRKQYGTKKSSVPEEEQLNKEPMIIVNGQQKSLQELETAFEQLKHR